MRISYGEYDRILIMQNLKSFNLIYIMKSFVRVVKHYDSWKYIILKQARCGGFVTLETMVTQKAGFASAIEAKQAWEALLFELEKVKCRQSKKVVDIDLCQLPW